MAMAQGRHGYIQIGTTKYPAYNWQLSAPRNISAPTPVGSSWSAAYGEGLQTSRIVANFMLRNKSGEGLGDNASDKGLLGMFLTRTFNSGFDNTADLSMVLADGKRSFTLANVKAESFVLSIQKGQPVGLQAVFVAPTLPTAADITPAAYTNQILTEAPIMYNVVTFTGLTGSVYGFEVMFANNHVINAPLDGTKNASSFDPGPMTASARVTIDARTVAAEPFVDGATLTVAMPVTSPSFSRTLTLKSVVPNNPQDANVGIGPVFRTYDCGVFGGVTGGTTPVAPVVLA